MRLQILERYRIRDLPDMRRPHIAGRRLDLVDCGAQVTEQHSARRACAYLSEVKYADSAQGVVERGLVH